jgi:hypothetical protein
MAGTSAQSSKEVEPELGKVLDDNSKDGIKPLLMFCQRLDRPSDSSYWSGIAGSKFSCMLWWTVHAHITPKATLRNTRSRRQ